MYKCETCPKQIDKRTKCSTCRSKESRIRNPVRYFLNNLRKSATKRDIYFDLELEEFTAWAIKENFKFFTGELNGETDSVDRIERSEGYTIKNIQKLTVRENINKYHSHDKHNKQWEAVDTPAF